MVHRTVPPQLSTSMSLSFYQHLDELFGAVSVTSSMDGFFVSHVMGLHKPRHEICHDAHVTCSCS